MGTYQACWYVMKNFGTLISKEAIFLDVDAVSHSSFFYFFVVPVSTLMDVDPSISCVWHLVRHSCLFAQLGDVISFK